jgi:hypothetical protein
VRPLTGDFDPGAIVDGMGPMEANHYIAGEANCFETDQWMVMRGYRGFETR